MTLKEIAAEIGVSPSTVSRVLNGCDKNFTVKPELRKRILFKFSCFFELLPRIERSS